MQNICKLMEIYGLLQTELMCNQLIQPLHSNMYIMCIHEKHNYQTLLILCLANHKQLRG